MYKTRKNELTIEAVAVNGNAGTVKVVDCENGITVYGGYFRSTENNIGKCPISFDFWYDRNSENSYKIADTIDKLYREGIIDYKKMVKTLDYMEYLYERS